MRHILVSALALIATAPPATEDLLAVELRALGAADVKLGREVVHWRGSLELAYRACLWSRIANRVLLPLAHFDAPDAEGLYAGVREIDWSEHLGPDDTLAVDFSEKGSAVSHTRFGAQKVKDAIVDALRERWGRRPAVELETPRLRVNVRLDRARATVSIDLAGQSLHARGYRQKGARAPLKENLAAAVLMRCRWPEVAGGNAPLVDPMCGSGTLVIEAALMALDAAPGWGRAYFGFLGWRGHDAELWQRLRAEAQERRRHAVSQALVGSDIDAVAVRQACANAERARLAQTVSFAARPVAELAPPAGAKRPGLVIVNPPYGERLGTRERLQDLYAELGRVLKERFAGWSAHVLVSTEAPADALGLAPDRTNVLVNGGIPCRLLHFAVRGPSRRAQRAEASRPRTSRQAHPRRAVAPEHEVHPSPELENRLRKNLRHLGRWATREGVSCYRLYDADLPQYAAAVDRYEDLVHIQEYAAPREIDAARAQARFEEIVAGVREVLQLPAERLFTKVRRRQNRTHAYHKLAASGAEHEVHEGGHRFLVNLTDHLDTGLFLDGRLIRKLVGELARGRRFLNLFAYTGTATVYAAKGGAEASLSIDLSKTYLAWAERNLHLNGVAGRKHRLLQTDCREWLKGARDRFDLVLLDPPTFSSSKRMEGTLDVQRDHRNLIAAAVQLLSPDGILLFVTNFRRFRLTAEAFAGLVVKDLSVATLPVDFARNPRIHRCWRISRRA